MRQFIGTIRDTTTVRDLLFSLRRRRTARRPWPRWTGSSSS